jgi:hypothetical protein
MRTPDLFRAVSLACKLKERARDGHDGAHRGGHPRMGQRQWRVGLVAPTERVSRLKGSRLNAAKPSNASHEAA